MKLQFSPAARNDLVRLREFIRINNPNAAKEAVQRITETAENLLLFPKRGNPIRNSDIYPELTLEFGAQGYVLRYRLMPDAVQILRIWHFKENKP